MIELSRQGFSSVDVDACSQAHNHVCDLSVSVDRASGSLLSKGGACLPLTLPLCNSIHCKKEHPGAMKGHGIFQNHSSSLTAFSAPFPALQTAMAWPGTHEHRTGSAQPAEISIHQEVALFPPLPQRPQNVALKLSL